MTYCSYSDSHLLLWFFGSQPRELACLSCVRIDLIEGQVNLHLNVFVNVFNFKSISDLIFVDLKQRDRSSNKRQQLIFIKLHWQCFSLQMYSFLGIWALVVWPALLLTHSFRKSYSQSAIGVEFQDSDAALMKQWEYIFSC